MRSRALRSPLGWLGGLLVVYLLVPVGAFLVRLAGSHDRGFSTPGLWDAVRVSVVGATIATAVITLLGVPLAHALARSRSRLAGAVGIAVQLPLALPPLMSGILLVYMFGPYTTLGRLFHGRLTNSLTGVVLAQAFVAAPFLVIAARSAFAAIEPALDEVAATLGHRALSRLWRVSLPVAAPGIGAGMLLTWLRAFGEYGATVLLAYHPYSLPVYTDVQFSGTGLFPTQAPTAIALLVAACAIALSRLRRPRALASTAPAVAPVAPAASRPTAVAFDLDVTVGTFRLAVAHRATSHRLAILGPSGSGKSLTLRSLAGLLGPAAGSVSYGGRAMAGVATESRHIGYVPQGLGLLPHRTVWQQVVFATDADMALAAWWLRTLHLDGMEDRYPGELSGGQRQRVSLAQALSRHPEVVLLDEPFSALDAPVRQELRREVRRLQRDAGLSTVLVTHDPEEAALLADEIVVVAGGRVLQGGATGEVFSSPASPEVARLLGMGNVMAARTAPGGELAVGEQRIAAGHDLPAGIEVLWSVRPECVQMSPAGRYLATVTDVADLGTVAELTVCLAPGAEMQVRAPRHWAGAVPMPCRLDIDPVTVVVWPAPG